MAASTTDLKRVLTLKDLFGISIGQVIGAGIMSLMGVAISITGRSVPISFVFAAILVLIINIPTVIVSGVVRLRGGGYTMAALLCGKRMAGFLTFVSVVGSISLSVYALSFADYALAFLPQFSRQLIAFVILTVFYALNIFGIDKMAKVQNVIVLVMCLAMFMFAIFGLTKVSADYLTADFMPGGITGVVRASAILIFAVNGAYVAAGLSGESKHPTRDIPIAIIASTLGVTVLYALMGVVASGVLPVSQVAGKSLGAVAQTVLPGPLYVIFMVGGAMFALISTLNAQMASAPKGILQACVDGWLPKKIGWLHPRYKTPVVILTFFYVVGLLPIFFGLDIQTIASMTSIITQLCMLVVNICVMRLPKLLPDTWKKSRFYMPKPVFVGVTILCAFIGVFNIFILASSTAPYMLIGNTVMMVISLVYVLIRDKSGKVHVEISYELDEAIKGNNAQAKDKRKGMR